jgi:hypothetical protein
VIVVIAGLLTIILWRFWIGLIVLLIAIVLRLWMRTSGWELIDAREPGRD